ncbi:GntR family transcriptional regulator [Paeniglutamicibacter cryotolerans]|uniref:GntR family transcriptional regulator n=1 Tax=Paeniglutamicibacter cryotolerans TaxID=670079 RepID=A0A839QTA2_9MICC|nr:GntR family transcriptional regulator [Paeniglutamicibacter cryotolerans]MBB2997196.1 GntR family transcriptional regulator [Paeniglutamicibacter cryotolerans]
MKRYALQPLVIGALNPESPVSKHRQLRAILRTHAQETCKPGDRLPPERELAEYFDVARKTLRQAIDSLVEDQVLKRVVGVGTFVAHPKVDLQAKLTSYTEEMHRRGMVPAARVLRFDSVPAVGNLAREMGLAEGTPVVRFRRLLLADGTPMSLDDNFIPEHLVPGFLDDEAPMSLYQRLDERYGLILQWAEDEIEAAAATVENADLLKVEIGFPLLRVTRHAYVDDNLIDFSVSVYRSDRYKLFVPIQRHGMRPPRYTKITQT